MGITVLVSREDATPNLSSKTYFVIIHKSLIPQGFDKLDSDCINSGLCNPAASLSTSRSPIPHAYTIFLAFREIYILEVPHFALISRIKMP